MRVRVNAIALSNLLIGLQDASNTCHDLAELTGLRIGTVRHYLNIMHAKGIIHICDWNEDAKGGRTLKVFTLGSGTDMPKPPPKGPAAACAKYRAKMKQAALVNIVSSYRSSTTAQGVKTNGQQTPSQHVR